MHNSVNIVKIIALYTINEWIVVCNFISITLLYTEREEEMGRAGMRTLEKWGRGAKYSLGGLDLCLFPY